MKMAFVFVLLFGACSLMTQVKGENQRPPKSKKGQLTEQGCVSHASGYYILMQSGNSYVLETTHNIDLGHYLGQQVHVTGYERATLGTSSGRRDAPGLTIVVDSINSISKRCTH
jgi:hypothetical protein